MVDFLPDMGIFPDKYSACHMRINMVVVDVCMYKVGSTIVQVK